MKEFNKLVRDKIPAVITNNGEVAIYRVLNDEEYLKELNIKLLEEVNEYLDSGEIEELADIEEVLLAILKTKGVDDSEFNTIRNSKALKRGAFNSKIFLERTE